MPSNIDMMSSPQATFARIREREAMEFGGPRSHWPRDHARLAPVVDDGRTYELGADDITAHTRLCSTCEIGYESAGFRRREGGRTPRFDLLNPEIAAVLRASFANEPQPCPRCEMFARFPWTKVAYANLTPVAVGSRPLARLITGSTVNRMLEETPAPADALFHAGGLAITSAAVLAVAATPDPSTSSHYADRDNIHTISRIRYGWLGRHQRGVWGESGDYARGLSADPAPGMLASRAVRNARAVETGKGAVVARYPLDIRQPVAMPGGPPRTGPAALLVRTFFGRTPAETVTAVTLEG